MKNQGNIVKGISVLIPTYNEESKIARCISYIHKQTLPRNQYEIIIVDASTDKTPEIARKLGCRVVKQKSEGVGGARNDGVEVAKYNIIAATDADVIVPKDWLQKVKTNFEKRDIVALCGIVLPLEKHDFQIRTTMAFLIWWAKFLSFLGLPVMRGNNCMFRKKEFLKVKGYRDLAVLDDFEIGLRLQKLGKVFFDPTLVVDASGRRIAKDGTLKYFWTYLVNGISLFLTGNVTKVRYSKQTY